MGINYQISVVMPLYNVEDCLKEAVDSVIGQSIGFINNIQIIFVNDGSTDGTEEICLQYKEKYPKNIVYVSKPNGGVSSARNYGMNYINGRYTVFFDGDDKWEHNAFSEICTFFDKHIEELDVCFCKLEYIGDYENRIHPLDYKYKKGTRIVNLMDEPECINLTIGNTVFKSSAIKQHSFLENLLAGEDAVFTNSLVVNNPRIGLISKAIFNYRRNYNKKSLSSRVNTNRRWFLESPLLFYITLFEESIKEYDCVLPFIQNIVLYDLQWRNYKPTIESILSKQEIDDYKKTMKHVISYIDDVILCESKFCNQFWRLYYFHLKYENDIFDRIQLSEQRLLTTNGDRIFNFFAKSVFQIRILEIEDDEAIIGGVLKLSLLGKRTDLFIENEKGDSYKIELSAYEKESIRGFVGEPILDCMEFNVRIPIHKATELRFFANINGQMMELNPSFGHDVRLVRKRHSHFAQGKYIVTFVSKKLRFSENSLKNRIYKTLFFQGSLIKRKDWKVLFKIIKNAIQRFRIQMMPLKKQVVCVGTKSNEILMPNMNALFEELDCRKIKLMKESPYSDKDIQDGIKAIYSSKVVVVDDYSYFLRRYGKKRGQHVLQIWHAGGAFKKFGKDGTELISALDEQYHRHYDIVCTSAEYVNTIYAKAFGIPVERVRSIGVPRTDVLFNETKLNETRHNVFQKYPELCNKEIILYAPTFREGNGNDRNVFVPEIDFQLLSDSLNDNQLFIICPHPIMTSRIVSEDYRNILEIRDISTNDMMVVCNKLITDYSSIIFDYALLDKPMAFFCYDYEEYSRGFYLDYEKDIPGPILRSQQELIEYIVEDKYDCYNERRKVFREKYMSACDGRSAKKVAEVVKMFLNS